MQQQCNATKLNLCLCLFHTNKQNEHLCDVSQQEAHTENEDHHTQKKPSCLPVRLFFSCSCSCWQRFPVMIHSLALLCGECLIRGRMLSSVLFILGPSTTWRRRKMEEAFTRWIHQAAVIILGSSSSLLFSHS